MRIGLCANTALTLLLCSGAENPNGSGGGAGASGGGGGGGGGSLPGAPSLADLSLSLDADMIVFAS